MEQDKLTKKYYFEDRKQESSNTPKVEKARLYKSPLVCRSLDAVGFQWCHPEEMVFVSI